MAPSSNYIIPSSIGNTISVKRNKQPRLNLEVTLSTFSTPDRISTFLELTLNIWKSGPISLAYYVKSWADVDSLDVLLESSDSFRIRTMVHVVWPINPKEAFPINVLRNIAESKIETSHVFHCDVDMVPSRQSWIKLIPLLQSSLEKDLVIILPVFEQSRPYTNKQTLETLPLDIPTAKAWLRDKKLRAFHYKCKECQSWTDYVKWQSFTEPYYVSDIGAKYEPYVVLPKGKLIWSESFCGYGRDKSLFFFELFSLMNHSAVVLPDVFLIHHDHHRSMDAGKFRRNIEYREERADFFDKQKIKLMERYDDMGKLPEKYRQMIKSRSNQAIPYGTVILLIFLIWFGLMIRSRNSKNKLAKD